MDTKMIKDPVHGYIKIRDDYVKNIIDSCEFQRLRNIRQTSYDSLYPGSCHNRFIHSLGVYYLGAKAFHAFQLNSASCVEEKIKQKDWEDFKHTFELACLLHDVGHTPFSHTGEDFLLAAKEKDEFEILKKRGRGKEAPKAYVLYNDLLRTLKNKLDGKTFDCFYDDFSETVEGSVNYKDKNSAAKPHEIMSVIVALDTYDEYLKNEHVNIDLFARAILGIKYKGTSIVKNGVKNALIQMLNSSIIDVDRLDYIMRDMQMSGFDSTSIDIERLLESVILIRDPQTQEYFFGYKKNAMSTIENVVLAHDAERKWIQGHPVVMYDSFLIGKCISAVEKKYREKDGPGGIFQKDALTAKGIVLKEDLSIKLMNDGDFIFLMKQIEEDNPYKYYISEYLSRDKRRSPIWKSESEFQMLLEQFTPSQQKIFQDIFTAGYEKSGECSIGSTLSRGRIVELEEKIDKISKDSEFDDDEEEKSNTILTIRKHLFWLKKLESFYGADFNIHNERANVFQSKMNDLNKAKIRIWYDQFQKSEKISKVIELYNTNENREVIKLFYWYVSKPQNFSMDSFIEFLRETLRAYEAEFIDSKGM